MRSMGNLDKIEALCELLVEWNLLEVNDEGQYFSSAITRRHLARSRRLSKSFEGD